MMTPRMPSDDHEQFDAICSPLEDFETLPTVVAGPTGLREEEEVFEERSAPLDGLILAGLVAPY